MFDYDKWQEIFGTIRKNKLRTFLTVLGIFWGIFMIIILLGAGNSFREGVSQGFSSWTTNSGFVWGQRTTISHQGFQPGKYVRFDNSDTKLLWSRIHELRYLAPRNSLGRNNTVIYKEKSGQFEVLGDYPDFNKIQIQDFKNGRFINQLDIDNGRKVAVIGPNVNKILFGDVEDPIGEYISIRKINFKVIGVIDSTNTGGDTRRLNNVHLPFTTFQKAFNFGDNVGWYAYSVEDGVNVEESETRIIELLKNRNNIHPLDEDAIGHFNLQEEFDEINGLFDGLKYFTWFVGLSTLFAGIIGVSNIMLIIVKERTKEIGIRKSLGATPFSIVSLILQESIFLTLVGGYMALVTGLLLLDGIAKAMPPQSPEMPFAPPTVNPAIAFGALGILVIGGMIAGILPAKRAASISPVEAIRTEG